MENLVYIAANPVEAHLVKRSKDYPGVILSPKDVGRKIETKRPSIYKKRSKLPHSSSFIIRKHPAFSRLSKSDYVREFSKRLLRKEQAIVRKAKKDGKCFLGREGILRQSFRGRPKRNIRRERIRQEGLCARKPRVKACNSKAFAKAMALWRSFQKAYRAPYLRWRAGERNVVFPPGTNQLRRFAGVNVASD